MVYEEIGNVHEALKWNQEVIISNEKLFGKDHLDTALSYGYMGLNKYIRPPQKEYKLSGGGLFLCSKSFSVFSLQ